MAVGLVGPRVEVALEGPAVELEALPLPASTTLAIDGDRLLLDGDDLTLE